MKITSSEDHLIANDNNPGEGTISLCETYTNSDSEMASFLSLEKNKIILTKEDLSAIHEVLPDFVKRLIYKFELDVFTITDECREVLAIVFDSLFNNENKFECDVLPFLSYNDLFLYFSFIITIFTHPSELIEVKPMLTLKIQFHRKYCKARCFIADFEIIYHVKERYGMILSDTAQGFIKYDNKLEKIEDIKKKYNSNAIIIFKIEDQCKEIDTLRVLLLNFLLEREMPRNSIMKDISDPGYTIMMSLKSALKYKCQNCKNIKEEHILRINFRLETPHKCRIHLCISCFKSITKFTSYMDCLSCNRFVVNYSKTEQITFRKINKQLKF